MRLKSGKTLAEITLPTLKNPPPLENNARNIEEKNNRIDGGKCRNFNKRWNNLSYYKPNVSFDDITRSGSLPTTFNEYSNYSQGRTNDYRRPFYPNIYATLGSTEYHYGTPTIMMADLQTNA